MKKNKKEIHFIFYFSWILAILGGTLILGISWVDYSVWKTHLDSFAGDGKVDFFTPSFFESLQRRLRWGASLLGGVGILLALNQKRIQPALFHFKAQFSEGRKAWFQEQKKQWKLLQKEKPLPLILLGFFLLAFFLRLLYLNQPIRADEAYSFLNFSSQPIYILLGNYAPNNHLFHNVLVHLLLYILPGEPWAIRLVAFFSGVFIVPVFFWLTSRLYGVKAALFSTAILVPFSSLIEYSVNGRGYLLMILLMLSGFLFLVELRSKNKTFCLSVSSFLFALAFFSLPIALIPFLSLGLWLVWTQRLNFKEVVVFSLGVFFLTFVFYFPTFLASGFMAVLTGSQHAKSHFASMGTEVFFENLGGHFLKVWEVWDRDLPLLFSFLMGSGVLISLWREKLRSPLIWFGLVSGLILLIQQRIPFVRVWLFLIPIFFLAVGHGWSLCLQALIRKGGHLPILISRLGFGTVFLSLALSFWVWKKDSIVHSHETGSFRDAKPVVQLLSRVLNKEDRVLAHTPSVAPLQYYFQKFSIPSDFLYRSIRLKKRLFVVVHTGDRQSLEFLLKKHRVPQEEWSEVRLVKVFDSAQVYSLKRRR